MLQISNVASTKSNVASTLLLVWTGLKGAELLLVWWLPQRTATLYCIGSGSAYGKEDLPRRDSLRLRNWQKSSYVREIDNRNPPSVENFRLKQLLSSCRRSVHVNCTGWRRTAPRCHNQTPLIRWKRWRMARCHAIRRGNQSFLDVRGMLRRCVVFVETCRNNLQPPY